MTTELEKTLLDTFGIKPKSNKCELAYCAKNATYNCKNCEHFKPKYPQITDRHYLELICVLNKHNWENYQCCTFLIGRTIGKVKNEILLELIENSIGLESETTKYNKLKHQVQAIFEGEN